MVFLWFSYGFPIKSSIFLWVYQRVDILAISPPSHLGDPLELAGSGSAGSGSAVSDSGSSWGVRKLSSEWHSLDWFVGENLQETMVFTCFCLCPENRTSKTHIFEYRYFGVGWGGGWGMLTYLVLRTWSIATLLRSLGWFTTLHVATLLLGWGGGWGMLTYLVLRTWSIATLLRSLGWFTTLHVATLLLGWGGGWGMLTYLVLRTWSIATLLRSLGWFTTLHVATLLLAWGGGWGMLTYLVLRTWSIATLLRSLGWFTTLHVATLLLGWGGGVGDVNVPCASYMIHCYAAEISGMVYHVTRCYAAAGLGWGGGGC